MDLKERREELGLNLIDIAEAVGRDKSTISRWEKKGWVPVDSAPVVAEMLECNVDEITKFGRAIEPRNGGRVVSGRQFADWVTKLYDAGLDRDVREILVAVGAFVDRRDWITSTSIKALANRAGLDDDLVQSKWDQVLDSGFVERVGTAEWTLRLIVPENGGD